MADDAPAPLAARTFADRFIAQFTSLTAKNARVLLFRWRTSLLILLAPALFVVALYELTSRLAPADTAPRAPVLSRCASFDVNGEIYFPSPPCVTLAYAPAGDAVADAAAAAIARGAGLTLGVDVRGFASAEDMAGWAFDNAGTQVDASLVLDASAGDASLRYELWLNTTLLRAYAEAGLDDAWRATGVSGRVAGLQRAVDAALISGAVARARSAAETDATLGVTLGALAEFEQVGGIEVTSPATIALVLAGAAFIVVGCVVVGIVVLVTVAGEKQRGLTGLLKTMGLYDSAYVLSWAAALLPLLVAAALLVPAAGAATGLVLFARVNFGIHFFAALLLLTATVALSLACAACAVRPWVINAFAFCHFAVGATLTILFGVFGLYAAAYAPTLPPAIYWLAMFPFPFFHYGRLMSTVLLALFKNAASGAPPPVFDWAALARSPPPVPVNVNGFARTFTDRAPSYDLWMMLALTVLYGFVAWYAAQVLSGEAWAAQPFYFPLLPSYWGLAAVPQLGAAAADDGDTLSAVRAASGAEHSIRVHKVSKSYKQVTALKEVTLAIQPSQMTCLLGQNGAGKSTLLKLLSGLASPTHGAIFSMGRAVADDMGALRDVMGVSAGAGARAARRGAARSRGCL